MKKKADLVFNGLINVPNIDIEYNGFNIKPKLDMGSNPWQSNGNTIRRGYIVLQGSALAMPGGAWFQSIIESKVAIDCLIEAEGDFDKFWNLFREYQGLIEYEEV